MSDVSVEIFQDQGSPLGGYAVIRFNGLWLLPPNATFTIEPVDEKMAGGRKEGWPAGKRRPLETRVTSKGIEILVGPEIVDAPLLLPGTPVTISVPEASVKVEARWPNLPVSRKVRGDPVVVSAEQLLTEVATLERARHAARQAVPPTLAKKPYMNGTGSHDVAPAPPAVPEPARLEQPGGGARDAAPAAETPAAATAPPAAALAKKPASEPPRLPPAAAVPAGAKARPPALAFAAGFLAAVLLSALVGYMLWPKESSARPAPVAKVAEQQVSPPPVMLHAAFVAGPTSPRGRAAESVEISTALMLADQSLHAAAGEPDREEASFWLRKALSKSLGGAQISWALTQLGTIYAERTTGTPDFQTAKTLWEIAAAHGDPIALCFLGSLNENGLGLQVNKKAALGYYTRAKELGGCPGLEQSLARLTE